MKTIKQITALSLFLCATSSITPFTYAKDEGQKKSYAQTLPNFSLKDPAGKKQNLSEIKKEGVIVVVTAPILSNKDAQEGWSKHLTEAKGSNKGHLIFVEDMQPSSFKGKALSEMKKDYKPGKDPILMVDDKGILRKKLKVSEKETVVLAYNKEGKLMASEEGKASSELAQKLWKKINQ